MNRRLIIVGAIAVLAFGATYVFMTGAQNAPRPVVEAPKMDVEQVLVASQDLPMGTVVNEGATSWQAWPKAAISEFMITKSDKSDAMEDVKGAMTRQENEMIPCVAVSVAFLLGVHSLVDFSLQMQAIAVTFMALLGAGVAQSESSRLMIGD